MPNILQRGDMVELQIAGITHLGLVRDKYEKQKVYITTASSGGTYPIDRNVQFVHRFGHMSSQKYWAYHMMHAFAETTSDKWRVDVVNARGFQLVSLIGDTVFVTLPFIEWWVESGFMAKYQPDETTRNRWTALLAEVRGHKKGA